MYKSSKGEQQIESILKKEKIKFEREKTFSDLKHGLYRFDFYLPLKNILIEYQGEQHYQFTPIFHKNKSEFTKSQERDRRKISYALAHGIKLYCIPYWEIENLQSSKDLFQDKFLAYTKFHNDNAIRHQKNKLKSL